MSKPKPIQITIPHPCTQNWDEMTRDGDGRFCDHCQKKVIDFTAWSDTALYNFFSKDTGNSCGRFLATQLDRRINIPYQPHSRLYRMFIAMGLVLLTQTPEVIAQNRPPKTVQTTSISPSQKSGTPGVMLAGKIVEVHNSRERPIMLATVLIFQKGNLRGRCVSDFDGRYRFQPSLPFGKYKIEVKREGYHTIRRDVIISGKETSAVNFLMHQSGKCDTSDTDNRVFTGMIETPKFPARKPDEIKTIDPARIDSLYHQSNKAKKEIDLDNPTKRTYTRDEINQMPH